MSTSEVEERAEQLEAMMRRLIGLVSSEAAAVRAHRLSAANADWDEKERLVHAWRIEVSRIKGDPSLLSGLSQMRKEQLRASSRELETALEAHAMALAASKSVTEGLVRSIASEIASVRAAPAGYGRSGVSAGAKNPHASGLAVNAKA